MALFDGARAKLERAREQLQSLQAEFQAFLQTEHHAVDVVFDAETGVKTAVYRIIRHFPIRWAVIIGEIIHDIRSALDHAIYELTVMEQGHPLDGTEFPVFDDEPKYFLVNKKGEPVKGGGLYKVRGVNTKAKAIVKDLQPFEFRKTHAAHEQPIVTLLHELNIIDKHRTLNLCRQRMQGFGWRAVRDIHPIEFTMPLGKLEDGTVLGRWKPAMSPGNEVDMEFHIVIDVAFDNAAPILNGQRVIPICESLIRGAERVLYYLEGSVS